MKTLILDTSSDYLYIYLNSEKDEYEVVLEGKNNHSEKMMDLIEEGLNKLNLEVKDLDRIICGIGPGSYTGLRVSLTVCKIFAWTAKIDLYTISSLDILGSEYLDKDGRYAICNIAKKDYLYSKIVDVKNGEANVVEEDMFILKEEFLNRLDKDIQVIDKEKFAFNSKNIIRYAKNKVDDIHNLVPKYLRKANSWNIKLEKWRLMISMM